jgi:hypothetical protein
VPRGRLDAPSLRAQGLTQLHQVVAQVLQRSALIALGPEGPRQPGAADGAAMPQGEEGEQPFNGAGAHARQRPSAHGDAERAEEVDGERRDSHGSIPKPVGNNHQAPRQRPNARGARG